MPATDINLADRSGSLLESHKSYDPRILFFYFLLAALLLVLAGGLAYQQLTKVGKYANAERQQNQRRILVPGPRGNIYDREGRLLVGNTHRFAVILHLDELKAELHREYIRIRNNYRATGDKDLPSNRQLQRISRATLVQRYLDQVNVILGRDEKVNATELSRHFDAQLLLPYPLIEKLEPSEYARLIERLPVRSPLEVFATNTRSYPYGSAAAHTLGYVRPDTDVAAEGFPGDDLTTFKMKGTSGRDGLEKWFDGTLQGEAGGRIYRVDPTGYKINPPLEVRLPKQGRHVTTTLDIDLQLTAEETLGDQTGAVVALDVRTGEVLVMASKPSFDLNLFSPRATREVVAEMNERGAWVNLAMNGFYPPGSTFKILTSIAGLRNSVLTPSDAIVDCNGWLRIGNTRKPCYNGHGVHHEIHLADAIAKSCDIYYYVAGQLMGPDALAAEARRFHLDQRTGIELPGEQARMIIPDTAWKRRERNEPWYPGDTANVSIGQGDVLVTPLGMACFTASVARGETFTRPTLLHQPGRPRQQTESIGLTTAQRAAVIDGMVGCTTYGTAKSLTQARALIVPGITIAGKTGTAQKRVLKDGKLGNINLAWFICYAPVENPEVALAIMVEGDTIGEELAGGLVAAPIASALLRKYFEKRSNPARPIVPPFRAG